MNESVLFDCKSSRKQGIRQNNYKCLLLENQVDIMMNSLICPCGRPKTYVDCCGQIHQNHAKAITAEDLMRSRYTAFVLANGDYLMQSHHSGTRPISEKKEIIRWAKSVKWIKLEVLNTTQGSSNDNEGTVEFKAYFKEGFVTTYIHENSYFTKENGNWMYVGEAK